MNANKSLRLSTIINHELSIKYVHNFMGREFNQNNSRTTRVFLLLNSSFLPSALILPLTSR